MRLFSTIAGLRCYLDPYCLRREFQDDGYGTAAAQDLRLNVGLVPTMGALHEGHLSLIERARRENQLVVVSIFVNPLQFGPQEDLDRYPRTLERDRQLCEAAGVDAIFAPTPKEMGIDVLAAERPRPTTVVPPASLISTLCGRSRVGHFEGVATIVTKLLHIIQPTRAYFGQKDAQQLAVIRQMVSDLNLPVEVVASPIVREPSGLALSSRNQYLTSEQREQATVIYQGLQQAQKAFRNGMRSRVGLIEAVESAFATEPAVSPEYIDLVDPTTMNSLENIEASGLLAVAARLGTTRLIDNVLLCDRQPIVAIDGPAGAGKSTVARQVAQALGLLYLDTGAMYRALTWLVLSAGVAPDDEPAIAELLNQCDIAISGEPGSIQVAVNGRDVTQDIRSLDVTAHVSTIAAQPAVRQELVKQQQRYGRAGGIVIEGRDIGTHVFPDAELKIFLTASVQERARRRQLDLKRQGVDEISLDKLEQSILERDRKDSTRALAPLCKAVDAIEVETDGLTIEDVVKQIIRLYEAVTR